MSEMRRFWLLCCVGLATLAAGVLTPSARPDPAETPPADGRALFREQVRALLTAKCLSCHGGDKKRGGLDLTRRVNLLEGGDTGPALKPGHAKDSLLFQRVAAKEMPPKNPLTTQQTDLLRRWIDAGGQFDQDLQVQRAGRDWWSLRPVSRPTVPALNDGRPGFNAVDAFVLKKQRAKGLGHAPGADRLSLIRRATYDLTGLPPTPEEIDAFENDDSPDAFEKVIDRLLASPAYGEKWGRHWLDIVRFAESSGYEMNNPRANAWPYRDYVIRAFNRDTPYPEMILEHLAGDTLPGADLLTQSATGFLVGGPHDTVFTALPELKLQQRYDDLDDMVSAAATTFLGLTVNCARCHDHKFDPISQKDYYSLQAVFAGVQHAERQIYAPAAGKDPEVIARIRRDIAHTERLLDLHEPVARPDAVDARRSAVSSVSNVDRFAPVKTRAVRLTVHATYDHRSPSVDEVEVLTAEVSPRNVALATSGAKVAVSSTLRESAFNKPENLIDGQYGNAHSWASSEPDTGTITVELAKEERIDRVVWSRDRNSHSRDRLPIDYTLEVQTAPGKWRVVASSADRKRYNPSDSPEALVPVDLTGPQQLRYASLIKERLRLIHELPGGGPGSRVYAGTFLQPGKSHLMLRGDPAHPGEVVKPTGLSAVRPPLELPADAPERDRRVALARWLAHPDNPLPARVMVNRVWQYHFGEGLVATPSDFGFLGSPPSHPELLDWLATEFVRNGWHLKPLHRLLMTSATYRQSSRADGKALAVDHDNRLLWRFSPRRLEAEEVRDSILTLSGRLERRMGGPGYYLWLPSDNYVTAYKPKLKLDPEDYRRMVYLLKPRSQQDPVFGVFDCPDASTARPKRTSSTTVFQSLNLLNSDFVLDQCEVFAARLQREAGVARQVERSFRLTLGRRPSPREAAACVAVVEKHGLPALCRALWNTNEFLNLD
jgi:cytochrome c553